MKKYYSLETNGSETDIYIFGDITSLEYFENDVSSYTLSKVLQTLEADKINVHDQCPHGECVRKALAIYNMLRNHKAKVKTICEALPAHSVGVSLWLVTSVYEQCRMLLYTQCMDNNIRKRSAAPQRSRRLMRFHSGALATMRYIYSRKKAPRNAGCGNLDFTRSMPLRWASPSIIGAEQYHKAQQQRKHALFLVKTKLSNYEHTLERKLRLQQQSRPRLWSLNPEPAQKQE